MKSFLRKVLLLVTVLVAIGSALAQTTAVSNFSQTTASGVGVGKQTAGGPFDFSEAISFTTGSIVVNFVSVTLGLNASTGSATGFSTSLYSTISSAGPATLIAALNGNSTIPSAGNYVYSASVPFTLLANTTYWFVASAASTATDTSFNLKSTASLSEDVGALAGWSIGDLRWLTNNGGTSWFTASGIPLFSVQVSAIPEPSTYAALLGLVAIGFAAHRRRGSG